MKVADLRSGGKLSGPGTGTSDSILGLSSAGPVKVSNAEYVIKATSAAKLGKRTLDYINKTGKLPKRQGGGTLSDQLDERRRAYEEAQRELERQSKLGPGRITQPVVAAPVRPVEPVQFPYVPSGERPLFSSASDAVSAFWNAPLRLPRFKHGGRVMKRLAVGGEVETVENQTLSDKMPNPKKTLAPYNPPPNTMVIRPKVGPGSVNWPGTIRSDRFDPPPFARGGSVMKAKILKMKNRGKVLASMAKNRAGYKGGGEIVAEYESKGRELAPSMKDATYKKGGGIRGYQLGGSLGPSRNLYEEEGLLPEIKRASISSPAAPSPVVAATPAVLPDMTMQDPSKVKVDPAPGSSIFGRAFTGGMNMLQRRTDPLRPYKKGGLVVGGKDKKGLRC